MAVKGLATIGFLGSKHINTIKHIAKEFGLKVSEDKEEMLKAIDAYQNGGCADCEKNNSEKKTTMIASATGRKGGCVNCK